jgi:hypothetical protein
MLTDFIAPILYVLLFVWIIRKWQFFQLDGVSSNWMSSAFALKVLSGLVFWAVYTYYYTDRTESDAFRYFSDTQLIRQQWTDNRDVFWSFMLGQRMDDPEYVKVYDQLIAWTGSYRYGLSNDCSTIIRINVVISFISFGSFHVHALFMAMMSFVGLTAVFKAFSNMFSKHPHLLFAACFLLPSVVFWSSSLLKEGPLFLFLGLMFLSAVRIYNNRKPWINLGLFVFSFVLLIYIKGYVIISLLPALLFLTFIRITSTKLLLVKFIGTHIICFLVAQNAHHFFVGGDFLYVLHKRQIDFYNVAYMREAGSVVDIPPVTNTWNFLIHYPRAFALTYFRPYIWEADSIPAMAFSIENMALMFLILIVFVFPKKPDRSELPILLFCASFVLAFAAVLGNCVPVLGAMVRYKIPALPFFVIICLAFIDLDKLIRFLKRKGLTTQSANGNKV